MQKPTQVVGKRVAAFIIDALVSAAISVAAWFALTTQVSGKCPSGGGGFTIGDNCRGFVVGQSGKQTAWYAIVFAGWLVIYVILPGLKGTSPGKALLGIRLVNAEGRPPGVLRAFLRYILLIVDEFPYILPMLTGFIVALNSERNQRVGDMAAGTFVVDKNAAGSPAGQVAPGAPPGQYGAPPSGPPVASSAPPPGAGGGQKADWYPDPQGQARLRYWDGQRWTDHTSA
ncbi:MAG: hypothetical protein QOE38_2941 [Thermoleophilaceae bacterium]|jgi:uncharacterized RDD family membrane protein YckC|nr:hypothetical protein [Thermoleophilaceae bacterium]